MKTSDFDYSLPPELIAQTPIEPRSQSRLMVVNRKDGSIEHRRFFEITDYLRAGDVLVFNNSRVIPARLRGNRTESGGKLEILLLRQLGPNLWETLVKPARRLKAGASIEITGAVSTGSELAGRVTAKVVGSGEDSSRILEFSDERLLPALGEIPLPPYIHTPLQDPARYQTVYAEPAGSVAAPTAGLHFTPELIDNMKAGGIHCLFTTLHIGLDTFRPVREDDPREHKIHREYGELSRQVADELCQAKLDGRRIICVGTTSARLVEAAAQAGANGALPPFSGWVDLFIIPGHRFRAVDALITNFHLPKSTLLMLVSAFAGKELIDKAYREAIAEEYRFYSFGDAMLVL
ncbi:MAG: tRNA preQ1(34) S-adenosylmethionine ribosyltransferase-isomerase QueA [Chloroflexi bacterium]|nr:tRNA preQ1(34) S-adenosylmethionine ribosyltransferase-isomerase QueA [Chloroflexota bacterium]